MRMGIREEERDWDEGKEGGDKEEGWD